MRRDIEAAEDELTVEVQHSTKFLCRGKGLRDDFVHAGRSRQRTLLNGLAENEKALLAAMEEAQVALLCASVPLPVTHVSESLARWLAPPSPPPYSP